jgi:HSP20 family protein
MIKLFNDPFFTAFDKALESKFLSTPETNIQKNNDGYVVSISVPGLTKDDLKISIKDGILKISYEKTEGDNDQYFIGAFVKSYNIPDDVKEKDIEGKVENGVLTLTLPLEKKKPLERLITLN